MTDGSGTGAGKRDADRLAAQREAAVAWDRVGRAMQDGSELFKRVADRNLKLWGTVSGHLKQDTYGADDVTTDAMQAAALALRNATDAWFTMTRPPEAQNVARVVPTVLLVFDGVQGVDPTLLRVPEGERDPLPETASIEVHGDSAEGADALREVLSARLDGAEPHAYRLEGLAGKPLTAGNYGGFVYLTRPTRLLADLKIVVTGSSPATPASTSTA